MVVYSNGSIKITETLAIINGVSYPINGIVSVFASRKKFNALAFIIGLVSVICGFILFSDNNQDNEFLAVFLFILGLVVVVGSLVRPYYLVIQNAAGSTNALKSHSLKFIAEVRSAIEEAVSVRG